MSNAELILAVLHSHAENLKLQAEANWQAALLAEDPEDNNDIIGDLELKKDYFKEFADHMQESIVEISKSPGD